MQLDRLTQTDSGGTHAKLFLRADGPVLSTHRETRARLDRLADAEALDSVTVSTWPTRLNLQAPHATGAGRAYDRFTAWASRTGADLAPAFTVRDGGTFVDDSFDELLTPVRCLAVENGTELVGVFPSVVDGTHYSVDDAISALETQTRPTDRRGGPLTTRGDD